MEATEVRDKIIKPQYETLLVEFEETISEIDLRFSVESQIWGVIDLKEWIDTYESSRFTQIDQRKAVITSEYNMDHIVEWLDKNTKIARIKRS